MTLKTFLEWKVKKAKINDLKLLKINQYQVHGTTSHMLFTSKNVLKET